MNYRTIATAKVDGRESKGDAKIVQLDNGQYELQLSNFWIKTGAPDAKAMFSQNPDGKTNPNTMRFIAELPFGNFENNYPIDHLNDLEQLKTIIIWCEQYDVYFGHGTIVRMD